MMNLTLCFMPFEGLLFDLLFLIHEDKELIDKDEAYLEKLKSQDKSNSNYIKFLSDRLTHNQLRHSFETELFNRLTILDYKCTFDALDKTRKAAKSKNLNNYGFTIFFSDADFPTTFIY